MLACLQKIQKAYVPMQHRCQCIKMFTEQLQVPHALAVALEEAIAELHYTAEKNYVEEAKRVCFNIKCNPSLLSKYSSAQLPLATNEDMARGTFLEKIRDQETQRALAVENMLRERYENVNKSSSGGLVRCHNCGSSDIAWQQKQTKGADESMTIFCTCSNCKTRWKMS